MLRTYLTIVMIVLAVPALAADRTIDADKLLLRRTADGLDVVFVARDPNFLFPAIGSSDDPVSGAPGGVVVELFSKNHGVLTLAAGASGGSPGWRVRDRASRDAYRYRNPGGPDPLLRTLDVKEGRLIRIRGKGLAPLLPHQSVGVRITFGSTRNCALFAGAAVQKDSTLRFVGKNADTSALADCSDDALLNRGCGASLFPVCDGTCPAGQSCSSAAGAPCVCVPDPVACTDGAFPMCDGDCPVGSVCGSQDLSSCVCIPDADPCGDTSPTCNGQCPVGEQCAPIGGVPTPNCGCVPDGQTPCSQNMCGGACPIDQECNFFETSGGFSGCLCGPPGPCGSGGDDCPVGFFCALGPGLGPACVPTLCSGGSHPTCGGSCSGGDVCVPISVVGVFSGCACIPPGAPCESSCSLGLECPPGQECVSDSGTCGCEPF